MSDLMISYFQGIVTGSLGTICCFAAHGAWKEYQSLRQATRDAVDELSKKK
jgi:hypothetical protein